MPLEHDVQIPEDYQLGRMWFRHAIIPRDPTRDPNKIATALTNRDLWRVDLLLEGKLLPLIERIEVEKAENCSVKVLDCPGGVDSVASFDMAIRHPDIKVYSVDLMAGAGRKPSGNNFQEIRADAFHLPFASKSIDLLYSWGFLFYFIREKRTNQISQLLEEFIRVLKEGGVILIQGNYGDITNNLPDKEEFEHRAGVSIRPSRAYSPRFHKVLRYLPFLKFFEDRATIIQKLPNT